MRLRGRTAIDTLFGGDSDGSALAYPLRAVWRFRSEYGEGERTRMMVSIPKKRARRAVDRVLLRRRVREAYRLCRAEALEAGLPEGTGVDVAFVYVGEGAPAPYAVLAERVAKLLSKIVNTPQK